MKMRNLRQRFGALVVAGVMGLMMIVGSAPMHAAGLSGGSDACAFIDGIALKISGTPGATVLVDVVKGIFSLLYSC
jgi:Na+/proline symporter